MTNWGIQETRNRRYRQDKLTYAINAPIWRTAEIAMAWATLFLVFQNHLPLEKSLDGLLNELASVACMILSGLLFVPCIVTWKVRCDQRTLLWAFGYFIPLACFLWMTISPLIWYIGNLPPMSNTEVLIFYCIGSWGFTSLNILAFFHRRALLRQRKKLVRINSREYINEK